MKTLGAVSLLNATTSIFLFMFSQHRPIINFTFLGFAGIWLYIFSRIIKKARNSYES